MNFPIILLDVAKQAANPNIWKVFVNFLSSILEAINTVTGKIPEPFGGYGLAVILFTIIMRAALLPLDLKSKKSNQKISEIQPLINEINQKYKNDPEKKNKKTMELYQQHKANPLGGCLPMLIQLPLMFAMFAALNSISSAAVQSNLVDPFLWIKNIWQADSPLKNITGAAIPFFSPGYNGLFILPILAGVTSYYQMKLTTPKGGNQQMKGFTAMMPLMSVWFCTMYTASFAIYWVTANIFQIAQQIIMVKLMPPAKDLVKDGGK